MNATSSVLLEMASSCWCCPGFRHSPSGQRLTLMQIAAGSGLNSLSVLAAEALFPEDGSDASELLAAADRRIFQSRKQWLCSHPEKSASAGMPEVWIQVEPFQVQEYPVWLASLGWVFSTNRSTPRLSMADSLPRSECHRSLRLFGCEQPVQRLGDCARDARRP